MDPGLRVATSLGSVLSKHLLQFLPAYGERFESCFSLYSFNETLVKEQHADNLEHYQGGDVLIWGIATRTIKTYRAALYLAALGHGSQAVMLDRTLIEDALTVTWVDANRDEALRLMDMHERHNRHLTAKLFEERRLDLGILADLSPLADDELKEMTRIFGEHGQWGWTGHRGLRSLYEAVKEQWEPPAERALLDHIAEIDLRYANQRTHNTAMSLARPQDIGNTHLYDAGESTDDIAPALLLAFWAFAHATKFMLREPYRKRFMSLYTERMPTFFQA